MSLLCELGIHKWLPWSEVQVLTKVFLNTFVLDRSGQPYRDEVLTYTQSRRCSRCGIEQVRDVR